MADKGWTTAINTNVAHPARMYDYYLGGKDNFPATAKRLNKRLPPRRQPVTWLGRTGRSSSESFAS